MQHWSMRELARSVSYRSRLLMLMGYFDDSGTHDGAPVVVWGGVAGDAESMGILDDGWQRLLRETVKGRSAISQFHLTACKAGVGEFAGWSQAERDAARHDFRQVIVESGVAVVGFGVDVRAWEKLVIGPRRSGMTAECMAFGLCAKTMIEMAGQYGERVDVKFDFGRERKNAEMVHAARALYPEFERLSSWGWIDCRDTTGLQAADTIAHEFYSFAKLWVGDSDVEPDAHLRHFRGQYGDLSEFYVAMMGEAEISDLLRRLERDEQSASSPD